MSSFNQRKFLSFSLITLVFTFIWLTGCDSETKVITEVVHDTTEIVVNIISVDSIFAIPDSLTEGASIRLTASTTLRPEAGPVTFRWFAEAGSFDNQEGDTVTWTAPETPGAYLVTVHVSDGVYIGLGNRRIGVGMYAPTTTPFYLGADQCGSCHQDKFDEWSQTGHSRAWATLQESGHAASYCEPCHSVGFEPEPFNGNGGYDESPISKYVNVQCENCHGAASEHLAGGTPDPTQINIDYSVNTCGSCHEGEHHPYLEEWQNSPHNFDPASSAYGAGSNSFCQGCHEGVAASIRLAGDAGSYPLNNFFGGGAIAERPDTTEVANLGIGCPTCHDPHSDDNPGQLRTVDDVYLVEANGENPVITIGGVGKLCMQCHHARRGPESQIQNGYDHFGPHANPQADMAAGKSAYHGVADPNFVWAGPSHLNVQNSCKTCHLNTVEYGGSGSPAVTGHSFRPTVEACANCHGPISDFDDIIALEDFDGDGAVEGVQSEVQGLMYMLEDALVASGLDTTGVGFAGALGDTTRSTFQQREAGYNLIYLEDDKSMGIHNPDYAIQLLQQSIMFITGTTIPNAAILREGEKAVANF